MKNEYDANRELEKAKIALAVERAIQLLNERKPLDLKDKKPYNDPNNSDTWELE